MGKTIFAVMGIFFIPTAILAGSLGYGYFSVKAENSLLQEKISKLESFSKAQEATIKCFKGETCPIEKPVK